MITFISLLVGALAGFVGVKSGTFKEGGCLVLLGICAIAIIVAAFSGALAALLPVFIAVWAGRLAWFFIAFAVAVLLADR